MTRFLVRLAWAYLWEWIAWRYLMTPRMRYAAVTGMALRRITGFVWTATQALAESAGRAADGLRVFGESLEE